MTYLGQFILDQEREQNLPAFAIAKRMQMDASQLSKIKRGDVFSPNVSTLTKMLAGISRDPMVKARMIAALLMDVRDRVPGYPREVVRVTVEGSSIIREEEPKPRRAPNAEWMVDVIERGIINGAELNDLATIAKGMKANPGLRKMVRHLASVAREA